MNKQDKSYKGNRDEKEKSRELTEAEKRRMEKFEAMSESMIAQGYRKVELTVSVVFANVFSVILFIPVFGLSLWIFFSRNPDTEFHAWSATGIILLISFVVLTVVHELIHGLSWSIFTRHHWQDIEFGFMKQYLTPYCNCKEPLTKGQYIFGAVMPLVVLGIIPLIAGILAGSFAVLLIGIVMTVAAAGDILIIWKVLTYQSKAATVVYVDHPTQAGGVIFEK